ncbi:MAG TPA: putative metal-dependent hydrolase [Chitinophagaceae bacterium]|nr:putative metal-dependent hydrolase [Chitinophagaceae bacterium]HNF72024.1 putative metal-dependent hydrolase [Chitinophagaceae bacterium]
MNDTYADPQRYPIGPCPYQEQYSTEQLNHFIRDIEQFPDRLERTVQHLNEEQLQTPYRPGGWTIHQVIHHCADSHLNALLRIKLTLSNNNPVINPYPEAVWAEMADYTLPFNNSLTLLHALHRKLSVLLRSLTQEDLQRTYFHPEYQRSFRLCDVICLYAWHGNHHLAHIVSLGF